MGKIKLIGEYEFKCSFVKWPWLIGPWGTVRKKYFHKLFM